MVSNDAGVSVFLALLALVAAYVLGSIIYSVTLHPLADIPGPFSCAVSRIPWWIANVTGNQVRFMFDLHKRYGPVVRFGPNDLSYADGGQAWKDILGYDKGRAENPKQEIFHAPPANGVPNLITAELADHARVRKVFSPAFSERALKQQEPLFRKYVDALVSQLSKEAEKPKDLSMMFNLTTFDIMGDLTFGQPLGLLENATYTPWVESIFQSLKVLPVVQMIEYYPLLKLVFGFLEPQSIKDLRHNHWQHSAGRVDKRLEKGSNEPDIWNLAMTAEGAKSVSLGEMHSNAELFMTAGTETTASLLSGVCFQLIANPDKMKRLVDEIRGSFASNDSITLEDLAGTKYLNACIQEALRIYPPVPSAIPRRIPAGGNVVLGRWLPEGTCVSVHQLSSYRSPANFHNPDSFVPERWLLDEVSGTPYVDDKRDAHQPFSIGPRNCLGLNFAWHEIRLVLAKLVFNFDLELCEESKEWMDQKVYVVWERRPLFCRLVRVKSG